MDVKPSFLGGDELVLAISGCLDSLVVTAAEAAGMARLLAKSPMPTPPPPLGASAGRFASGPLVSFPETQNRSILD